jgi:hypothetical protein
MLDIQSIAEQVKMNCDISDARYVLEKHEKRTIDQYLRGQIIDLYITEMDIKPWEKRIPLKSNPNYQSWFIKKKKLWKELKDKNFSRINVNGREYRHNYMDEMNQELNPEGYFYSATIGYGNKISFLLAQLVDTRKENGYGIYILEKELARDLEHFLSETAFQVEGYLVGRKNSLRNYFWKRVKKLKSDKNFPEKKVLEQAFLDFGLTKQELSEDPEEVDKKIEKILPKKMEVDIHHELGHEITQRFNYVLTPELYYRLTNLAPGTDLEWFIRGVDEVLADTSEHNNLKGMLSYVISQKDLGSLSIRLYDTMVSRKFGRHWKYYVKIFPELITAYEKFRETGDWGFIENARKTGQESARKLIMKLRENQNDIDSVKSICEKVLKNETN